MNELLTQLIAAAKTRGLQGIVVLDQGGRCGILAACLGKDGHICDPRNWDTHPSPESALKNLASVMKVTIGKPEVTA